MLGGSGANNNFPYNMGGGGANNNYAYNAGGVGTNNNFGYSAGGANVNPAYTVDSAEDSLDTVPTVAAQVRRFEYKSQKHSERADLLGRGRSSLSCCPM